MKINLYDIRKDYSKRKLSVKDCFSEPLLQCQAWLTDAIKAKALEPTAMNIATVGADLRPSARMVLLKELDDRGFVFFTNYESQKGEELARHPGAALTFFWPELERQMRIEGEVEKLSPAESDEYFASRPHKSQVGAWASRQSQPLKSKASLLLAFAFFRAKNPLSVKRPPYWGGYRVVPYRIEFWQGRPSRLHDRVNYELIDGTWQKTRLSP